MELGPIPAIRRISPVKAPDKVRDLSQALAPERSGRIGNDADDKHSDGPEPADEDSEASVQDKADTEQDSGAPVKKINFIA